MLQVCHVSVRRFLCSLAFLALLSPGACEKKKAASLADRPIDKDPDTASDRKPRWSDDSEFFTALSSDQSNLTQFGEAFRRYAAANAGCMPPAAIFDDKGKPLLSWRVAILPFVGQEYLFKQFKLDEPWDSVHNRNLIPKMPSFFGVPESGPATDGFTHYRVFAGVPSRCGEHVPMFDWPDPINPAKPPALNSAGIRDGLSNTILIAETEQAVIWTKPAELIYDPTKPLPKLGYFWKGRSNVVMGDGTLQFVDENDSEQTLRSAIGRQEGGVLERPRWASFKELHVLTRKDFDNLKIIGMGMTLFAHRNNNMFPPAAICDANGKPLLSWRVAILPHINEGALFDEFKLDEPWDSEHNKRLIAKIPPLYVLPGRTNQKDGVTHYRVFVSPHGVQSPRSIFAMPSPNGGAKLQNHFGSREIPDGPGITILVAESEEPVVWTKPEDLPYDAKQPLPKLGYFWRDWSHTVMATGEVRTFPINTSEKMWRSAITADDGDRWHPDR